MNSQQQQEPCVCCGDGCPCGCVTECPRHVYRVDGLHRTPDRWSELESVLVLDPDGWRSEGAPSWDTPIGYAEWERRMMVSTIQPLAVSS